MKEITITIWISPDSELIFFRHLKVINDLSIDNNYTWRTEDIRMSKAMISNWTWVNLPLETYLKFYWLL